MNYSTVRRLGVVLMVLMAGLLTQTAIPSGAPESLQEKSDDSRERRAPDADRVLLPLKAFQQTKSHTCGPATLITLLRFYGRDGDEMQIAKEARVHSGKRHLAGQHGVLAGETRL